MELDEAQSVLELARAAEAKVVDDDWQDWKEKLDGCDIEAAVRCLIEAGAPEEACDLVGALSVFWQDTGKVQHGRELTETVLAATAAEQRSQAVARARLVLGELAFRQGDQAVAREASMIARDIGKELGDRWIEGRSETNLARVAFRDGEVSRIFEHAQRVCDLAGDNLRLQSGGVHMLAWAHHTAGEVQEALDLFEKNAALFRQIGNEEGEASELANIGDLALEAGDIERARYQLTRAFSLPAATASNYLLPSLVRSVAVLAGLTGDDEGCVLLVAAADAMYGRFGLTPDPGDELSPRVLNAARQRLGVDAVRAQEVRAATMSADDVVERARLALG
jgi:tetratricopeptide (TPR) repeat protein